MRLVSVHIENFRAIEGSITFDNRAVAGLPLLIHGANGIGKSTIFDAVTLLLFRIIDRKGRVNDGLQSDELINHNASYMKLAVTIKGVFYLTPNNPQQTILRFECNQKKTPKLVNPANAIQYRVFEIKDGIKRDVTSDLKIENKGTLAIGGRNTAGFRNRFTSNNFLNMDYNAFRSSIFIAQDAFSKFFKDPNARQSIIRELLNVNFEAEETLIRDHSNNLMDQRTNMETELEARPNVVDFNTWCAELSLQRSKEAKLKDAREQENVERDQHVSNRAVQRNEKQKNNNEIDQLRKYKTEAEQLELMNQRVLGEDENNRWENHTRIPTDVREAYRRWNDRYSNSPNTIKTTIDEQTPIPDIQRNYDEIHQQIQRIAELRQIEKDKTDSLETVGETIAQQQTEIEEEKLKIKDNNIDEDRRYLNDVGNYIGVKRELSEINSLHPKLAQTPASERHEIHQSILQSFEKGIQNATTTRSAEKRIQKLQKNIKKSQSEQQQLKNDLTKNRQQLQDTLDHLETLSNRTNLDNPETFKRFVKDVETQYKFASFHTEYTLLSDEDWDSLGDNILSSNEEKRITKQIQVNQQQTNKVNRLWQDILQNNLLQPMPRHLRIQTVGTRIQELTDAVSEIEQAISTLDQHIKDLETSIQGKDNAINTIKDAIQSLKSLASTSDDVDTIKNDTQVWFASLEQIRADLALFDEYRQFVGFGQRIQNNNIFTNRCLGLLLTDLVNTANRYLNRFTNGIFHMEPSEGTNVSIRNTSIDKLIDYSDLSGGQRFLICLAFSLSLADQLSNGQNERIHTLVIDEGFGSLDEENCQSVVNILKEYSEEYDKDILCIAHTEYLKSRLGNSVELTKENGVNTLNYVNRN